MKLKTFKNNYVQVNSYLLIKENDAVLIDPGFNAKEINQYCDQNDVHIGYIFLTHGHFDHIQGINEIWEEHKSELYISDFDKEFLYNDQYNHAMAFGMKFKLPEIKINKYQSKLSLFDEEFEIIETPGHTKGCVCIKTSKMLFSGDTLFYDSIGRTDLYSGNHSQIFKSLKLLTEIIGNDYKIYPGHGPSGTFKDIKQNNPYL
jgi:glyoxylase-like metal-dependent hydrolase (beta-lactamase superfamily II)